MKKYIFSLFLIGIIFSCNKKDEDNQATGLTGTWKLIETLADPGNGSGIYEVVESDKTIEFHEDGTVTSNGSLCDMSIESGTPSSGTYSISDSTISSHDCIDSELNINFESDGTFLIIHYPCIESCRAKFIKVN